HRQQDQRRHISTPHIGRLEHVDQKQEPQTQKRRQSEKRGSASKEKSSGPVKDEHGEHGTAGLGDVLPQTLEQAGFAGFAVDPNINRGDAYAGISGLNQRLHAVTEAGMDKNSLQGLPAEGPKAGGGV